MAFNSQPALGSRRQPQTGTGIVRILVAVALIAYLCQVTLFGPIRFFLQGVHLEPLWYVPDLLGFMCIGALLLRDIGENVRTILFLIALGLYALEGYVVSGSVSSVLSTFKALVPVFCGFLLDRDLLNRPLMKVAFFALLLAACAGVFYSMMGPMPWANIQFEAAGVAQKFKAMQWVSGGDVRNFGFGGDQHSAASSIGTLFMLLAIDMRKRYFYPLAALALVAIYFTTSRTNLMALFAFIVLWSFADLRRAATVQPILKWSLWLSFFAILVPLIIIELALSFSISEVPPSLLSLWIRGTVTWLMPFQLMDYLSPYALVSGFGLGGFGFGLLQSDLAQYFTTVDNFILYNYLAFGVPYLIYYLYQCRSMLRESSPHKVMVYIATAIYGLMLRGWSDYLFMILVGYSTSRIFVPSPATATKITRELRAERAHSGAWRVDQSRPA